MTNHARSSIRDLSLEDEDREFKSIIESQISFQRSTYPQQPFNICPTSSLTVPTEVPKKVKKSAKKKQTTSITSPPPNFMKLEGRTRLCNISKLPQLRILKRDIRRRYMEMYSNVLNSHDINLYSRFLHEFCTPNCQSVVFFPSCKGPIVRSGIEDILQDTVRKQAMLPDGVLRYAETKIYVPLETPGSRIVASFLFRGTKLFDILPDDENEAFMNNNSFSSSSSSSSLSSISNSNSVDADYSKSEEISKAKVDGVTDNDPQNKRSLHSLLPSFNLLRLSPSPDPMELHLNAELTIHLDPSNRIERFVVDTLSISSHKISVNT